MARRRCLTVVLVLFLLSVVGVVAYPYVRYRAVTLHYTRGFDTCIGIDDEWRGPDPEGVVFDFLPVVYRSYGLLGVTEAVNDGRGFVSRTVGAQGAILEVMSVRNGTFVTAWFEPDGTFLRGSRGDWGRLDEGLDITEEEAHALLGPYLKPDGMPWPWWTRLPYFASHLRGE